MKSRSPALQSRPKTSTTTPAQPGEVRIISGQWRGRKLPVLDVMGLRPTTDRVKETLFNWLMQDTQGRVVLDCFSGSGSLAFEALSRHAHSALLLERDSKAAAQLKQNLARLQCSNAEVRQTDTMQFLAGPATQQFDLVFIDPPFRQGLALPCAALLQQGWLKPDALIYLETEKELDISGLPESWRLIKDKIAGQLAYRLFVYQPIAADAA
jgi:16S rRNA (guanine966-N2)-methyltransferase